MKPIYDAWLIQIEITNACNIGCANCTRMVGHHKKPYFMDMDFIEKALDSLEGFKGGVGIMGGEPTLHPQFEEICRLLQGKNLNHKSGLWTSGYKWDFYKELIRKTFKRGVYYNDHSSPKQRHQPILIAIEELVDDKEIMWKLIDNCWVHDLWSPSINPKGAFFCEVAAALDLLFDGPGGYPVEQGWWNKTPSEFRDQVERYCPLCGGSLPFTCPSNKEANDLVTPKNYERLLRVDSPKAKAGKIEIFNKKMTNKEILYLKEKWKPWDYLGESFRKKDLKFDEIPILKGVSRRQTIPLAFRHPCQALSLMFKYPKNTVAYASKTLRVVSRLLKKDM